MAPLISVSKRDWHRERERERERERYRKKIHISPEEIHCTGKSFPALLTENKNKIILNQKLMVKFIGWNIFFSFSELKNVVI